MEPSQASKFPVISVLQLPLEPAEHVFIHVHQENKTRGRCPVTGADGNLYVTIKLLSVNTIVDVLQTSRDKCSFIYSVLFSTLEMKRAVTLPFRI